MNHAFHFSFKMFTIFFLSIKIDCDYLEIIIYNVMQYRLSVMQINIHGVRECVLDLRPTIVFVIQVLNANQSKTFQFAYF